MNIQRSIFYRVQHVTGPTCVLVSIRFGKAPERGPKIIRLLVEGKQDTGVKFDLSNHVTEVLAGVAKANGEFGGHLEIEAIEVIPDDYPSPGQAHYVAYKIAGAVLRNEI